MGTAKLIQLQRNEDLISEINRLHKVVSELQEKLNISISNDDDYASVVHSNGVSRYIKANTVSMIKADSNYSTIYLNDGTSILTSKTLKHWEEKFNCHFLLRIHSGFLVNSRMIIEINHKKSEVLLKGNVIANFSKSGKSLIKSM